MGYGTAMTQNIENAAAQPVDLEIDPLILDEKVITDWATRAQDWITGHLLSMDTAIQIAVVLAACIIGGMLGRMMSSRLSAGIEATRLPLPMRSILQKIRRLTGPLMILLLLFVAALAHQVIDSKIDFTFVATMTRLTAAWIIIRVAVQIVSNPMARNMIASFVWILTALSIFGVLDDTARALDSLNVTMGGFRLSALIAVKALIATLIMLVMAGGLSKLVEHQLGKVPAMTPGSRLLITKLVRLLLGAMAIIIGITMAGVNLSMLTVFSGAVGLGIGLGLQRGVSNLFTGMMLLMDKTIQPGDLIEMPDGTLGKVSTLGSRCTELRSLDNRSFLIPNEELVAKQVVNWTRGGSEVVQGVNFSVDYKHNPHDVIKIALEAVKTVPRVMTSPEPGCLLQEFGESSLNFRVGFWIADPQNGTGGVKSDVLLALWDAFQRNGIEIPYPYLKVIR